MTTTAADAQNKLSDDIEALVEAFKTENPEVTLESLHYEFYPAEEGGRNARSTIRYTDAEGASLTRSL